MGRVCDICGKGTKFGNNVSHSHKKTKRNWKVNLFSMTAKIKGSIKKIRICTRCIRTGKIEKVVR